MIVKDTTKSATARPIIPYVFVNKTERIINKKSFMEVNFRRVCDFSSMKKKLSRNL